MALADETMMIEGDTPVAAFLDGDAIVAAARAMGAGAIHPGYGFLSENAASARAVEAAGTVWIGPAPATLELMGDKIPPRRFVPVRRFPVASSVIEADDPDDFAAHSRQSGAPT